MLFTIIIATLSRVGLTTAAIQPSITGVLVQVSHAIDGRPRVTGLGGGGWGAPGFGVGGVLGFGPKEGDVVFLIGRCVVEDGSFGSFVVGDESGRFDKCCQF